VSPPAPPLEPRIRLAPSSARASPPPATRRRLGPDRIRASPQDLKDPFSRGLSPIGRPHPTTRARDASRPACPPRHPVARRRTFGRQRAQATDQLGPATLPAPRRSQQLGRSVKAARRAPVLSRRRTTAETPVHTCGTCPPRPRPRKGQPFHPSWSPRRRRVPSAQLGVSARRPPGQAFRRLTSRAILAARPHLKFKVHPAAASGSATGAPARPACGAPTSTSGGITPRELCRRAIARFGCLPALAHA
jgi:hypothetical protein